MTLVGKVRFMWTIRKKDNETNQPSVLKSPYKW